MASGDWTQDEIARLTRLRRSGATLSECAAELGRSKAACATKWTAVGGGGRGKAKAAMKGVWYGAGTRDESSARVVRSAPWSRDALQSLIGCASEMCTHVVTAE